MRSYIDIINDATHDSHGDARDLDAARSIYASLSPMAGIRLRDKITGIHHKDGKGLVRGEALIRLCVEYIAAHMDEFAEESKPDTRDLGDGDIHRLY